MNHVLALSLLLAASSLVACQKTESPTPPVVVVPGPPGAPGVAGKDGATGAAGASGTVIVTPPPASAPGN